MIVKSHDKLKKSLFGPEKFPLEKIEFEQRAAMIFIEMTSHPGFNKNFNIHPKLDSTSVVLSTHVPLVN